jgi:hypothetical protein
MTTAWIRKGGDPADKSQHVIVSEVTFYPAGGGLEHKGKASSFFEQFEPVPDMPEVPPLRPVVVQIEDGARMEAWTDGRRWNGWECPWVTRENFERLMKEDGWDNFSFDPNGDLRYVNDDYADEENRGVVLITPSYQLVEGQNDTVLLYDLSALGFIWSKAEEEEDEEL